MKKVGLSVYSFYVKNREDEKMELHNIENNNVLQYLYHIINADRYVYFKEARNEKAYCFDEIEVQEELNADGREIYTAIYGTIKSGNYGEQTEIINVETGNVAHNKEDNEADVLPYGFAIAVAAGEMNQGIVVVQSFAGIDIKRILHQRVAAYVERIGNEYRVDMKPVVPQQVLDGYFEGGILKSIRFIQNIIPTEESDRFGLNRNVGNMSKEVKFKNPVGFLVNNKLRIDMWRRGQIGYDRVVEIDDFEYDELKLDFKIGNSTKTIKMSDIENLKLSIDITDDVRAVGGIPTFENLKLHMKDVIYRYLEIMGLIEGEE